MADSLAKLPTDNTPVSPEENELIESLLRMTGESSGSGSNWSLILKAALILTSVFAILASPWTNSILKKVPGLGNSVMSFIIQILLFLLASGVTLWALSR